MPLNEGSLVLRDADGLVVDSLNYGNLVDPWAAQGYQAVSGSGHGGCFAPAPGPARAFGPGGSAASSNTSAGRFPDGVDTGSNCADFLAEPTTTLAADSAAGAANLKVASVAGFSEGQTIRIGNGASLETAVIATVGTPGATTVGTATAAGSSQITLAGMAFFSPGQTITIGGGSSLETAVVVNFNRFGSSLTLAAPLSYAHDAGAQVSGTGITLTAPLTQPHLAAAQVAGSAATPGAPNHYDKRPN
jgi:hypothetical protein